LAQGSGRRRACLGADILRRTDRSERTARVGGPMADKELDGRVALVTGSGRNIGRAIALDLAAAGAAVVVNARRNEEEANAVVAAIEAAGGRAFAIVADVTNEAAVDRMAA